MLYALAIDTGLRSSELRSLTRGRLFLDGVQPFVTCKAGSTKNGREARQFIQRETADGYLFPGQEADAVARVADLLPMRSTPLAATGTHSREDHQRVESSRQLAQQLGRVSVRRPARRTMREVRRRMNVSRYALTP